MYKNRVLRSYATQAPQDEKRYLESIAAAELFALALEPGVPQWRTKAVNNLTWRTEPIYIPEAGKLGAESVAEIGAKRGELRFKSWSSSNCRGTCRTSMIMTSKAPGEPSISTALPKPAPNSELSQPVADAKPVSSTSNTRDSGLGSSNHPTDTASMGIFFEPLSMKMTSENSA